MTKNKWRKFLLLFLIIAVLACISTVFFLSGGKSDPRLQVNYLGAIDGHGSWKLRFAITNIGNTTIITSTLGEIEIGNQSNALSFGATSPLTKLAPGQGQLIEAWLSDTQKQALDTKWRYKCLYARDGIRARIYDWQWGPGGRGARVNWLIPQKLKGMPLDVEGLSDWIEPVK
jgi:hypothetical protein